MPLGAASLILARQCPGTLAAAKCCLLGRQGPAGVHTSSTLTCLGTLEMGVVHRKGSRQCYKLCNSASAGTTSWFRREGPGRSYENSTNIVFQCQVTSQRPASLCIGPSVWSELGVYETTGTFNCS